MRIYIILPDPKGKSVRHDSAQEGERFEPSVPPPRVNCGNLPRLEIAGRLAAGGEGFELPVPFGPRTFVSTRFLPPGVREKSAPLTGGLTVPIPLVCRRDGMGRAARTEGPPVSCQRRSFFRARFRRRGCRDHARSSALPICGRSAGTSPCSPSRQGFHRSRLGPISWHVRRN
jgi:hypothetical protein